MPHTATRCVIEIALATHWYGSSNQEANPAWMNCTRLDFTNTLSDGWVLCTLCLHDYRICEAELSEEE